MTYFVMPWCRKLQTALAAFRRKTAPESSGHI
jgi:hypothetical protein